jgi:hypothetical protein
MDRRAKRARITYDELLRAQADAFDFSCLGHLDRDRSKKPPPRSITIRQLAKARSIPYSTADRQLRQAEADGRLESGQFWNPDSEHWERYWWGKQSRE